MNRRNACYTLVRNKRKLYPLVDNKLLTKQLLEDHSIPTPVLYFQIRHIFELKFLREIKHLKEFVIKPARGAEGRGILVIVDRVGKHWKTASGALLTTDDVEYHVSNILAGLYSLGGVDDEVFIEYFVKSHPLFYSLAYQGVPDIRMILYRGVPTMAMLRLPTKESGGRANLHQGAVGVGIDMYEGITHGGVHKNKLIERHPDTDALIGGVRIPFWKTILETSVRTFDLFNLGYIGIDFVIDSSLGPLILELNARPGLSIQLANHEGLLPRLQTIDSFGPDVEEMPPEKRLELTQEMLVKIKRV